MELPPAGYPPGPFSPAPPRRPAAITAAAFIAFAHAAVWVLAAVFAFLTSDGDASGLRGVLSQPAVQIPVAIVSVLVAAALVWGAIVALRRSGTALLVTEIVSCLVAVVGFAVPQTILMAVLVVVAGLVIILLAVGTSRLSARTTPALSVLGMTSAAVLLAVGLVLAFLVPNGQTPREASSRDETSERTTPSGQNDPDRGDQGIRVASDQLVVDADTGDPKVVLALYEDFLCPHCRRFEETFGETITELIDAGTVAVDYYPVAILDQFGDGYSSRAGGAAFCVADESVDAFVRFHAALFATQPSEMAATFPTAADLVELARQAGAGEPETVECIESGEYVTLVQNMAASQGVSATPTVRLNGDDYEPSSPDALVDDVNELVR